MSGYGGESAEKLKEDKKQTLAAAQTPAKV